jgi:hypothetical protein
VSCNGAPLNVEAGRPGRRPTVHMARFLRSGLFHLKSWYGQAQSLEQFEVPALNGLALP